MKTWKCRVCGYEHKGNKPPKECPQCSSFSAEFVLKKKWEKLTYNGEKFDVLLVNGSNHTSHNTGYLTDIAEKELKAKKIRYKRFNLKDLNIMDCWCCYSMKNNACTYPCRNQLDDMPALHDMMAASKAVIVISPINWNNMSTTLKKFLDRTTSLQNLPLLGKKSMTANKIFGVVMNGHEDGALKTAMDIFIYFQQMGYIMAPFSFTYETHGAQYDAKTDHNHIKADKKIKTEIKGVVNNVVEIMKQNLETKLRNKIKQVAE